MQRNNHRRTTPHYLHPAYAFCGIWALILALYSAHLSYLLMYPTSTLIETEVPILGVFLLALAVTPLFPTRVKLPKAWSIDPSERTVERLDRRLKLLFRFWICASIVEIFFSRGIPIVWLFTGSSKTYMDFGLPTIHGFLNSLLLSIAITRLAMAIRFGRRSDYLYPLWTFIWAILVITRQMMIALLLEAAIVYCSFRVIRLKRMFTGIMSAGLFVWLFGVLGDLRSGASAFLVLAQPTESYPVWLPSGLLWFYVYLTTPVNNLLYTFQVSRPAYDPTFAITLSQLFPTVLRTMIFRRDDLNAVNGTLVTAAFNVSTAFAGPYQDYGMLGILLFTAIIGLGVGLYWRKRSFRDKLCYAVLCQCLMLTVFFNLFVYLPVITQIPWIYLFFAGMRGDVLYEARKQR